MDVYLRAKFEISSIIQRVVDKGGGVGGGVGGGGGVDLKLPGACLSVALLL